MKTKAVIITGLPGTGKTTVGKALSNITGWPHLNTDMIRDELGLRGNYDEATKSRVYQELFDRLESLLTKGNVIIDGTFYRKSLQEQLNHIIEDAEAETIWVEVICEEDVIRQRTSKKREFSEADYEVYQKIKAEYDPVPEALEIDTTDGKPEDQVDIILKSLSS